MKRSAARLTLALAALFAAMTMTLANGDWAASVGSAQPAHYFGDVRALPMANCYLQLQPACIDIQHLLAAPC